MKTLAFVVALVITAFGAVVIVVPSGFVWIAQHAATSGVFCVVGTVRTAFGLVLVLVASVSRAPKTLRILGYLILIDGIVTAVMGLVAMERAQALIEWWLEQGIGIFRLIGVLVLALGGFIAYACAPVRSAA